MGDGKIIGIDRGLVKGVLDSCREYTYRGHMTGGKGFGHVTQ